MCKFKSATLLMLTLYSVGVGATEICSELLSNGIRDRFSTYTEEDRYDLYRNSMCNEEFSSYDDFASSTKDHGLSIKTAKGILGLTGSREQNRNSFSEKYARYCESTIDESEYRGRFRRDSSSINSALAKSFNQCVSSHLDNYLRQESLALYIDATPSENYRTFTIRVTRKNVSTEPVTITQVLPSSVTCHHAGKKIVPGFEVESNKFSFECQKPAREQIPFQLNTKGEGFSNEVTIPAEKDRLHEMESRIEELEELVDLVAPKNAVALLVDAKCPTGWKEYAPAYGRFVRGIDRSGQKTDPDGERNPGTLQDDSIQQHHHSFRYHIGGNHAGGGANMEKNSGKDREQVSGIEGARVSSETRPKNVALLFCVRN